MKNFKELKVLVIDDISTVRNVIKKSLSTLGIEKWFESDSINDALNQIKNAFIEGSPFDLIMCDWNMPGGDGIDLLKTLRKSENNEIRLTKFIMITGANDKVLQAMDAGANNIIHKPFTPEIINQKLELIWS